nr:hypothetical protein [Tanacetum cinerariifolium]
MDHNIDFSGSDQIQKPQYPDVQENPLTNDEFEAFTKANDDKMNNLETKFDQFQKQCEKMQDDLLNQMRNFIQNFQSGPPVQEPPQNSNMHQIIEECCVEASEEQKQKMEDTMLDLVKICHHKQFLCIHDDVKDLMESALDSKLLSINSINSQRLDKKEQEIKIVEEQPTERRNHAEKSLQNFRDDLLNQMGNFIQNFQSGPPGEDKEHEATTDTELFSTEDIQPLPVQEPPQNSNMHQIIEECCVEASEE